MKIYLILLITLFAAACSDVNVEELAFRKTLEYSLIGLCGERDTDEAEDKECVEAVRAQIKPCMESSDWQTYLKNSEDEKELARFTHEFYSCIVDADGDPYFESNL